MRLYSTLLVSLFNFQLSSQFSAENLTFFELLSASFLYGLNPLFVYCEVRTKFSTGQSRHC